MPDYQNAKIYRIVCNITWEQYIGSTTVTLGRRLAEHVHKTKANTNTCKSAGIIERGDFEIFLIENYPCGNMEQLHARERHYIETMVCINKNIPTRTKKEYRQDNKDKILEYKKEYYVANKDTILEHDKQYREANRETIRENKKQYYVANKDKICENKKQYYDANKDKITEYKKQYYDANKDTLLEQQKQHYDANRDKLNAQRRERYSQKKHNPPAIVASHHPPESLV